MRFRLDCEHSHPVAGFDPATHVLFAYQHAYAEDADARVKPGQGDCVA